MQVSSDSPVITTSNFFEKGASVKIHLAHSDMHFQECLLVYYCDCYRQPSIKHEILGRGVRSTECSPVETFMT